LQGKYNTNVDGTNIKPRPWRIAMQFTAWQKGGISRPSTQACRVCDSKCGLPVGEGWLWLRQQTQAARRGVQGTPCHTTLLARSSVLYLPAERPAKCCPLLGAGGGSRGGKSVRVGDCRKAAADVGAFHFGGAGIWSAPSVSSN